MDEGLGEKGDRREESKGCSSEEVVLYGIESSRAVQLERGKAGNRVSTCAKKREDDVGPPILIGARTRPTDPPRPPLHLATLPQKEGRRSD